MAGVLQDQQEADAKKGATRQQSGDITKVGGVPCHYHDVNCQRKGALTAHKHSVNHQEYWVEVKVALEQEIVIEWVKFEANTGKKEQD